MGFYMKGDCDISRVIAEDNQSPGQNLANILECNYECNWNVIEMYEPNPSALACKGIYTHL